MKSFICACCLALVAPIAGAQTSVTGSAGGYLVHERGEVTAPGGSGSDSSLGFGVQGHLLFNENIFAAVELQDAELASFRLGGGVLLPAGPDTTWVLGAALVDKDFDDGIGIFGGLKHNLNPQLELKGVLGYLMLGDFDGLELTLGGGYKIDRYWTAFADLRMFKGHADGNVDVDTTEFRFGASYNFTL